MIEVVISNGDRAEAPDPEGALLAARTLLNEAVDAGCARVKLSVGFYVDGKLIRQMKGRL